jgi:hypothetical protein
MVYYHRRKLPLEVWIKQDARRFGGLLRLNLEVREKLLCENGQMNIILPILPSKCSMQVRSENKYAALSLVKLPTASGEIWTIL